MKTNDLILALSADILPQKSVVQILAPALLAGIGISVIAFSVFWGPRSDIWAALGTMAVLKTVVPLGLVLLSGSQTLALAHPAARYRYRAAALGIVMAVLVGVFVFALARGGAGALFAALSTPLLLTCLLSIPVLALPIFLAVFWGISSGAVLKPRLTGAMVGLTAGGLAASIYSIFCDKDMVLFVLPAYSAAILSIALIGAILGPRLLKW